jgi:hypothetical protein
MIGFVGEFWKTTTRNWLIHDGFIVTVFETIIAHKFCDGVMTI